MATTVDERIVAAKFDASDFEKGVDKTLKKLDELKKSLDLKEAAKGVKELAEKTEVSTDSMSKSLEKLTNSFTNFTGMIKQQILSGLAQEVSNVFLKMEQSVTGFIRSISSAQVGAGMQKYEQMLTSVRVMMSAGETENSSYGALNVLRQYSDETSYSLSQMADALSKMRSAGVDLDTATKSVEGIANACANAGINATDAQRAFYNLSQAYAKGTLEYTDYRSLELLNMTTEKFKESMMEAAAEAGTLKKVSEGVYQTVNTTDKKVTAGKKVTIKNLQDMLKYDFMNNEAMNKLFGKKFYFDEVEFKRYKKKYTNENGEVDRKKAIEEAKKDFGEIAVDAYLAAREARSFTDVINTMKDVVSTGWSTTFEYLFGKLEEAKEFFTELAEGELADVVYKIGEYRNAILGYWNDLDAEGNGSGGTVLRQTILNISDALGTLLKTFMQILPGFDELDNEEDESQTVLQGLGDSLRRTTMSLRDFSLRMKEAVRQFKVFMNSSVTEGGPTRIELLRQVFSNLSTVLSVFARVTSIAFSAISKAFYTLSPILDGFLILFEKITEPLTALKNDAKGNNGIFKEIENSISNVMTILKPIADILGKIVGFLGEVGAFFVNLAINSVASNIQFFSDVLGLFLELFTGQSAQKLENGEGVLDRIRKDFEGIKDACTQGLGALKEFFNVLVGDVKKLLGLTEGDEKSSDQNGGVFSGLINFFNTNEFVQKAKAWVNQAIVDIGNFIKSIPSRIKSFGANIYSTLWNLFFKESEVTNEDGTKGTEITLTALGEWLDKLITNIKAFVLSIPDRIVAGVGRVGKWIDIVFNKLFGQEASDKATAKEASEEAKADEKIIAKFDQFVADIAKSIREWFDDLPNKIKTAVSSIGSFASKIIEVVDEFLFGKKRTRVEYVGNKDGQKTIRLVADRYKSGFSKFLDTVITNIKKFIQKIPDYIKAGIKGAGDIISTIINALFGKKDDKNDPTSKDIEERLEKPFLNINITNILNTIKEIGKEILNQIARMFTGTDNVEKNQEWFSEVIAKGIKWIREKAELALNWVVDFFVSIPERIANLFKGENKEAPQEGTIGKAILDFGIAIGTFISETLPAKVGEFIQSAVEAFGEIWDKLYNALVGSAEADSEEVSKEAQDKIAEAADGTEVEVSGWKKFVERLGKAIADIWKNLPTWIAEGIDLAVVGVGSLLTKVGELLNPENGEEGGEKAEKGTEKVLADTTKGIAEAAEKGSSENESKLVNALKSIGKHISDLFVTIIPGFISDAWKRLSEIASTIFTGIASIFNGEPSEDEKDKTGTNVAEAIRKALFETLPTKIKQIWTDLSTDASEFFKGFAAIFTGSEVESEIAKTIKSFGDTIYKFITEEIPSAIKKAIDFIRNLFTGSDNPIDNAYTEIRKGHSDRGGPFEEFTENLREESEEAAQKTGKKGFWDFITKIKDSLVKAFQSIGPAIVEGIGTVGPWIINHIAEKLDFLSNLANVIVSIMSGNTTVADEVEKAYGKELPELKESFVHIGESIKTFLLDTLPTFIGAAIGKLIEMAPQWFGALFAGIEAASESEIEKQTRNLEEDAGSHSGTSFDEAEKTFEGVWAFIKNFVNEIKEFLSRKDIGDIVTVLGIVVAIVAVFDALKSLFSAAEAIEDIGYTIKWAAILVAVGAISLIAKSLVDLSLNGTEEQVKRARDTMDRISGLFDKIITIMWLLLGGKAIGLVDDIAEGKANKNAAKAATALGEGSKIYTMLTDAVGGFLKTLGVASGAYIGSGLISASLENVISSVTSSVMSVSSTLGEMLDFIAPFVDHLVMMNSKMDTALETVGKIGDLFVEFYNMFSKLYEEIGIQKTEDQIEYDSSGDPVNVDNSTMRSIQLSMKTYEEMLQARFNIFYYFANFIDKLSAALERFGGIEDIGKTIDELTEAFGGENKGRFTTFMSTLFNALDDAFVNSSLSKGSFGTTTSYWNLSSLAMGLDMLSNALSVLGDATGTYTMEGVDALKEALDIIIDLGNVTEGSRWNQSALSKVFSGDTTLSNIGSQIKWFGYYIKGFYENISSLEGFEEGEVEETKRKVESIVTLTSGMAKAMRDVYQYGTSAQLIETLSEKMPMFATAISTFFQQLSRDDVFGSLTVERSEVILNAVTAVGNLIGSMADMATIFATFNGATLNDIIDRIFGDVDRGHANKLSAGILVMDKAISQVMRSDEFMSGYKEIGADTAKAIFEGMQDAFDEDPNLRPKITPVLNLDPMKEQMKAAFGTDMSGAVDWGSLASAVYGSNSETDSDRVKATELYLKIGEVATAISTMSGNCATVSDVTTAFTNMRIVTDTDALVGEIVDKIDIKLGDKIWLIEQGLATTQ